jgi:hypothetical protein
MGLFVVTAFFSACSQNNTGINEVAIGPYIFDFPASYYVKPARGVDSQVGVITNDTLQVHFDYGYYTNALPLPFDEFYEKGFWKSNLTIPFMEPGITYDSRNMPEVEILNVLTFEKNDSNREISENQMLVYCTHEAEFAEQMVYIPDETMNHDFLIDSIDNHYRKIVIAKDPTEGTTGIYLKDLDGYSEGINSFLALGLSISGITKQDQEKLVAVFKTGRLASAKP